VGGEKIPFSDWQFPFWDEFDHFWGGGEPKVLKKIYIPRVIFNIPSPPWHCGNYTTMQYYVVMCNCDRNSWCSEGASAEWYQGDSLTPTAGPSASGLEQSRPAKAVKQLPAESLQSTPHQVAMSTFGSSSVANWCEYKLQEEEEEEEEEFNIPLRFLKTSVQQVRPTIFICLSNGYTIKDVSCIVTKITPYVVFQWHAPQILILYYTRSKLYGNCSSNFANTTAARQESSRRFRSLWRVAEWKHKFKLTL